MKRIWKDLCAAVALLAVTFTGADAEIIATGTVKTGQTVVQRASLGGIVSDVSVQAGSLVGAGDVVVSLSLTQVYASCDGTVSAHFAGEGGSADDATEKYGGVLAIAPESAYTIYATAEYAYESLRTQQIYPGQTVYMRCTANGTHRGVGRITNVDGEIFTIEATAGEFYNGETVYVYLEDDYETADRLGRATVIATPVESVSASGNVYRMYVSEGDFVEKGQLLFETIGALTESDTATEIQSELDGYVTAVYAQANQTLEKDAVLMEVCPQENLRLVVEVVETDVAGIQEGGAVSATFDLTEERLTLSGTVESISYLPIEGETIAYEVHVILEPDARIEPGMQADVVFE